MFCDQCPSCMKINHGNHPDVWVTEAQESEFIKIEQVRELIARVQLRPFEAQRKVFIVKNVECFTVEGGNALLKTLEEPTPSSLLFLTTSVPEKVLDTVKSRCHAVYFAPSSYRKLVSCLVNDYDMAEPSAQFLAGFSQGSLTQAKKMHTQKMVQKKNEIIDNIFYLRQSEAFLKKVSADRLETKQTLDVILSWMRDALMLKAGADGNQLIHADRLEDIREFQKNRSWEELNAFYDEIVNVGQLFWDNLNIKVALRLLKEKIWEKSFR